MPDHAIVIGIDAYKRSDWNLSAAVRDAASFARWVTAEGAGRATPETVTLLLSPRPGAEPADIGINYESATRRAIHAAFDRYSRQGAGKGADRLWVFIAGHGVAPGGGGLHTAPVLVPEDVDDLDAYLFDAPLDLAKYLGPLQIQQPSSQIFFVDACRGIVSSDDAFTASVQLHFDLSKMKEAARVVAHQAVLYATTAGQLANELGLHGLFGKAVLEGLAGVGPTLVGDAAHEDFVLTFDALVKFTRRRVRELAESAVRQGKPMPTQEPTSDVLGMTGDLPLARFSAEQRPTARLKLLVEPQAAAAVGRAGIRVFPPMKSRVELVEIKGPPVPVPVEWSLPCEIHCVAVEASGFRDWSATVDLTAATTISAVLEPSTVGSLPLSGHTLTAATRGLAGSSTGSLWVECADRYARIEVFDPAGQRVVAGWGTLHRSDLPAGPYRVEVALPGQVPIDQTVLVTGDAAAVARVAPLARTSPEVERALDQHGFHAHGGMSMPSEAFGPVATAHIGSVLAWAAWVARFHTGGPGHKLRSLGIDPLLHVEPTSAMMQVLVGDALGHEPVSPLLDGVEVAVGPFGAEARAPLVPVTGLPGLAAQWSGAIAGGVDSLFLCAKDLQPSRLPVQATPGYATVIVLAREATGQIELHRYLNPLVPQDRNNPYSFDLVRRVELGFRALQGRVALLPGEAEELLAIKGLDPLAAAVLGYRLAREGRATLLERSSGASASPLERMRAQAPALPDVHVLSAIVDRSASRDGWEQHMAAAAAAGAPVVADGLRELSGWLAARGEGESPLQVRPFFDAGCWSIFRAPGVGRSSG